MEIYREKPNKHQLYKAYMGLINGTIRMVAPIFPMMGWQFIVVAVG